MSLNGNGKVDFDELLVVGLSYALFSFQRHGQNDSFFFTNTTDSGGPGDRCGQVAPLPCC